MFCHHIPKIQNCRRWPAPSPSPFCSSYRLYAALNSTEEMCFPQTQLHKDTMVARLQTHSKDALFKLASVTDTSMNHNNYVKRLENCLELCCLARTTGIFLGWTGYFLRKKMLRIRRKNPVSSRHVSLSLFRSLSLALALPLPSLPGPFSLFLPSLSLPLLQGSGRYRRPALLRWARGSRPMRVLGRCPH